jgi:hypothetical protein
VSAVIVEIAAERGVEVDWMAHAVLDSLGR